MRKWILTGVAILAGAILIIVVAGYMMPREHVASSSVVIHQPPDTVWRVIRDFAATPEWWSGLTSAERAPDVQGREVWTQQMSDGSPLPIVIERENPPLRLVTRIAVPDDAAFGGTWTYEIEPSDGGSRVTLTEAGFVNNPVFRFMANTVFGLHSTMDGYLRALGTRLGEEVTPVHGS